jgi:hypothetical protein
MAFDQATRNRLARFVSDARNLLTEEFTRQLQNEYGLDPTSGTVTLLEKLTALDDTRWETASILRETMAYYLEGKTGNAQERKTVLDRVLREQAFTVLNRVCALRLAEARGLILQAVGGGYQSQGFQLYARLAGPALGETGEAYRNYLFSLFDEMAVELPPLFDRYNPEGRLFPRQTTLLALLDLINDPELEALWAEDETIGWIYQYFNTQEERKAMRKASQAPRNSRELAVRNQFFTPRYVVEFLTDNTLGRIWYEMTGCDTALTDTCAYLVRRPTEIFLDDGVEVPEQASSDEELSQEELLRQPVYIRYRQLKDPREIKMLDPACGSMHFGLYAFDLFEHIYEEAWELEERLGAEALWRLADLEPLHETYPDKADFLRDVPRLIIEYNIHGIDIDPRAVQIAGLSLWLRAHKSWGNSGVRQVERPQILKSNIVCAEPMPGDRGMLDDFLATLDEARLETLLRETIFLPAGRNLRVTKAMAEALVDLVRKVWDEMELAGEAGSLLKVEETLREAIAAARKASAEKSPLFRVLEYDLGGDAAQKGFDFWDYAERLVLAALQDYAERSANGVGYRRRLFFGDAAQGFAFIELCRKVYDVVLMNPPFGRITKDSSTWLKREYPESYVDIYGCFILRALTFTRDGLVGILSSRSYINAITLDRLRRSIMSYLYLLLDLGLGVLDDALVEVACLVMEIRHNDILTVFDSRNEEDKESTLNSLVSLHKVGQHSKFSNKIYSVLLNRFLSTPYNKFFYDIPSGVEISSEKLEPSVARVRTGINTFDNFRFVRCWWEVDPSDIGKERIWSIFNKGGDFETYFGDTHLLVKWNNGGDELREINLQKNGQVYQSRQGSAFYYIPGLVYSIRSSKGFSVRHLPEGSIFSIKGPIIQSVGDFSLYYLLGLLNSEHIRGLVQAQANANQFMPSIIRELPWIEPSISEKEKIKYNAKTILQNKSIFYDTLEECINFRTPFLEQDIITLRQDAKLRLRLVAQIDDENIKLSQSINEIIQDVYHFDINMCENQGINVQDHILSIRKEIVSRTSIVFRYISYTFGLTFGRWDIRSIRDCTLKRQNGNVFSSFGKCPPGQLIGTSGLPATMNNIANDVLNPNNQYPFEITWEGIQPDDPGHPEDIINRTRNALHVIWNERAEAIEAEACEILGVSSLREYFQRTNLFFDDHLKRYSKSRRSAPIYWPLSTPSGSYTLWLYYHRINDQILYTCITDFVDPKLKQVGEDLVRLRQKTGRSRGEESELERLSDLERELKDFRSELLRVAAFWKPNLNDGVQITAAPLWRLFQHRNWQNKLKDTWEKLEAGEYDWAHLAYSIWPERVRAKCKKDKSLAIAHDLEHVYIEPKAPAKKSGKKKSSASQSEMFNED